MITSALIRVEVPSALWRKVRLGALDEVAALRLIEAFSVDVSGRAGEGARFAMVAVGDGLLAAAGELTGRLRLRAFDAVQLASAVAAREADPECATFACFDGELRVAASASGFELVP